MYVAYKLTQSVTKSQHNDFNNEVQSVFTIEKSQPSCGTLGAITVLSLLSDMETTQATEPAASQREKCIFCLNADGLQYVPLHFDAWVKKNTKKDGPSDKGKVGAK